LLHPHPPTPLPPLTALDTLAGDNRREDADAELNKATGASNIVSGRQVISEAGLPVAAQVAAALRAVAAPRRPLAGCRGTY